MDRDRLDRLRRGRPVMLRRVRVDEQRLEVACGRPASSGPRAYARLAEEGWLDRPVDKKLGVERPAACVCADVSVRRSSSRHELGRASRAWLKHT